MKSLFEFKIYIILLMFSIKVLSNDTCLILKNAFKTCVKNSYSSCLELKYKGVKLEECFNTENKRSINHKQKKYERYAKTIAKKYNINYKIIFSIIMVESAWISDRESNKKACGLMQLLVPTAKDMAPKSKITCRILKKDYKLNIRLGVKFFNSLLKQFNGNYSYSLALASYNMGAYGFLKRYNKNKKYPRAAKDYLKLINNALKKRFNMKIKY